MHFTMNEDLANIHYSPIRDYRYARWFEEVKYNGKPLSDTERKEFVAVIDEAIAQYSEGLPIYHDILESEKDQHDEYHEIDRTVVSVMLFVLITMIDSMVACKYFILADGDYDRRFMRGKLMVILNGDSSAFTASIRTRIGSPNGIGSCRCWDTFRR